MKLNTNSNIYIFVYSTILVIVVAFLLAFIFQVLKPLQDKNVVLDVKKQILYSLNIRGLNDPEAEAKYADVVKSEDKIDDMYMNYQAYSEGREAYGRSGNYSAKEDSVKGLEKMLESAVDLFKMLKEQASSQEEMELVHKYAKKISEM